MAGHGPAEMIQTPWGRADQLRERMLRPGPGLPREEVSRSQRERLFAAAVACIAAKGYEATTVADLLELSGVSRSAFYEHFHDREDCVLATFDALAAQSMELARRKLDEDAPAEKRGRAALGALLGAIVQQPAAARLFFCDVYTVGERGRLAVERSLASFVLLAEKTITEIRGGRELPAQMVHGLFGGAWSIVQSHLRRGEADALPGLAEDLWDWILGYEPPSEPLRLAGRRTPRPIDGPPPFVAYSQAERIVRALAAGAGERGYPAVTIAEIAARASVSQATFYSYFADKDAALVAALDSAEAQMLGVAMPAARRAADSASGIRAAIGGMCAFYAAEPDLARLVTIEAYAAGPAALEQRDQGMQSIRELLELGLDAAAGAKPIVADAVLGTLWALLYGQIVAAGPSSIPQITPLASYMVLAPFVGVEEATRVANGDGRERTH